MLSDDVHGRPALSVNNGKREKSGKINSF